MAWGKLARISETQPKPRGDNASFSSVRLGYLLEHPGLQLLGLSTRDAPSLRHVQAERSCALDDARHLDETNRTSGLLRQDL